MEGVNFEGFRVKCGNCGGWFHELTALYRNDGTLRGSYLRLLATYRSAGWYDFPHTDDTVGENIQCPQCMSPYRTEEVRRQAEVLIERVRKGVVGSDCAEKEEVFDAPEAVGDLVAPVPASIGGNNGLSAAPLPGNTEELVRQMTWDGKTQTEIAETCQISVYRVRQIQNGKGV